VVILAILMLSGAAAFLFSAAALTAGIERMALRYPLAALVGYSRGAVRRGGRYGFLPGRHKAVADVRDGFAPVHDG
jgi:hypothetical protein